MKLKNILVFGLGLIGGIFIDKFVDKKIKKSSNDSVNKLSYSMVNKDIINSLEKKGYIAPKIDINEISEAWRAKNEKSNLDFKNEDGTISDRDRISDNAEFRVSNETFDTVEKASEQVDGTVQLISEDDPIVATEKSSIVINKIDAGEFVKAVVAGANMNGFIFNILNKKLYWSYTNKEATPHEVATFVGTSNYADILKEANSNGACMITPKYYYNETAACFLKIEPGLTGENN